MDEQEPPGDPDDELYVIPADEGVEIPAKWQTVPCYELELPVRCPECRNAIRRLKVIKLSRSKVPFTSTLPRAGRATVCPQCDCILSVEISGVI